MPDCQALYHELIEELESTLPFSDAGRRASLLERVSDLFASGSGAYADEHLALFDDVLLRLTVDIEAKALVALAQRLARIDNAPPRLLRSLAFDDAIAVAAPVLSGSPQLSDADLVENARTKSQEHLYAIAQRLSLSESVTDVLVERGNERVVHRTVSNRGARFSSLSYERLVEQARRDGGLALAMGRRNDVPRQVFLKLVASAEASVRDRLVQAVPQAATDVTRAVDDVAAAMREETRQNSPQHSAALREAKRRYTVRGISEADVHAAARAQQFDRTALALSALAGVPIDVAERALLDRGVGMILTLAKSAGCSWITTKALLTMRAAERSLSPLDLERAGRTYERLRTSTASRVLEFHERRTQQHAAEALPPTAQRA